MSPELQRNHAQPTQARLHEGGLDLALQRLLSQREAAAFKAGERAGRETAVAAAVTRLDAATAELERVTLAVQESLVGDSVELALVIAAELVRCEVDARRHGVEAIVRDTLAASGVGRGACSVHLSPADAEAISKLPFRAGTRIEADPDVLPGCVQVETPGGLLVRDIEAALQSIGARLREEART